MTGRVVCTYCGYRNRAGAPECWACAAPLPPAKTDDALRTTTVLPEGMTPPEKTRQVPPEPPHNEPRWGEARIDEHTQVVAVVIPGGETLKLDVQQTGTLILGRLAGPDLPMPHLDLSPYGAAEMGVSREHLQLGLKDYSLYVTDLGSTNGTFLNGLRVMPNQPRIVRDRDEIRLGQLKLQIHFLQPEGHHE